jgi:hypothetical protein
MRYIPDSLIYLTGLFSTVCFVICGVLYSSNKTWFLWTLFGGLVLGLLTGFLLWQNEVWKSQESTTAGIQREVAPTISCFMEYPIQVQNKEPYRNTRNPSVIIKNSGPIAAVSLTAAIDIYVYDTKENRIDELIKTGFKGFAYAISTKELQPFTDIEHSTLGINGKDIIAIYSVSVNYYRESDMKFFELNEYFFIFDKTIYNNDEFKNDARHQVIINKIKSFAPPITKGNEVKITAAAEHTWFLESAPSVLKRRNEDGSVTIAGPSENQKESVIKGLPHLIIKPRRFEGSDHFIEAEVEGDQINAKVKYEVENIGDVTAVIVNDESNPKVEIEPRQKRFYKNTIRIVKGPNNNRHPQEFMESLDAGSAFIKIALDLLYHPKNDDSKLFRVTKSNEFGKHSVR